LREENLIDENQFVGESEENFEKYLAEFLEYFTNEEIEDEITEQHRNKMGKLKKQHQNNINELDEKIQEQRTKMKKMQSDIVKAATWKFEVAKQQKRNTH
jgi:tryptophanyl-tRNA synthetase